MIFFASLIAAFGITLWLVSYIAKMLHAKRPGMGWIFLAWLAGGILAALAVIPISIYAKDIDPNILFISTLVLLFIISSAAYKFINQMGWGGAFTTNIASSVIGIVALVMAIVLSGNSLTDTYNTINIAAQKNASMASAMAGGDFSQELASDPSDSTSISDQLLMDNESDNNTNGEDNESLANTVEDDDIEPSFKETDLLPKRVVKQIEAKQKPYVSPKYHVVRIGKLNALVGRSIRIHKSNGKVVAGSLQKIRGSNAVVKQRIHGGVAEIPVSIASIRKLEVYR